MPSGSFTKPIHSLLPVLSGPEPRMLSFTEGEIREAAAERRLRTHVRFLPADHPISIAQNTTALYICYESWIDDVALGLDHTARFSKTGGGTVYLVPLSTLTSWKM